MISTVVLLVAISCATTPEPAGYTLPSFSGTRPARPVLRDVSLDGVVVPDELLFNYNDIVTYALDLEAYVFGNPDKGTRGIEGYLEDVGRIISGRE